MANKEEFKTFVKDNPQLVKYVRTGDMTWQKFYEMYDLYGTEGSVWKDYLNRNEETITKASTVTTGTIGIQEIMNFIKRVDLDSIQNSVSSIQRVLGVLQDFGTKEETKKEAYKPRPIYKHFED